VELIASGATLPGAASVVIVNISLTHQIVRVVFTAVELLADDVFLTFTVCQFVTVPATAVHAHQFILYSHHADIDIALAALIHDTVIAADSVRVESATFV